ncbi:MAG: hypothetical protein ACLP7O_15295 [Terracidiphilus sp.]
MSAASNQSGSSLQIDRWRNLYCVPSDLPRPEEVQHRLDCLVEGAVVQNCTRYLEQLLDDSDPSIWLIREIALDFAVDANSFEAQRTAATWADQLARGVLDAIGRGANGSSVLHFASRAGYVAQWVSDAAAGCAGEKWYYGEFLSLSVLPVSTAIAEALLREQQSPAEILLAIPSHSRREAILAALTERDAERIWRRTMEASPRREQWSRNWVSKLLAIWRGVVTVRADQHYRDALRLLVAAMTEWEREDAIGLEAAIEALIEFRQMAQSFHSPDAIRRWLRAAARGDKASCEAIAMECGVPHRDALVEFVAMASGGDSAWAEFVAQTITGHDGAPIHAGESFLTELGGAFLIGLAFERLHVHDAITAAAGSCEEPGRAEPVLRHLLAVRCMGRGRASMSISDPAMRAFANLDFVPSLAEMAVILHAADAGAALRMLQAERPEEESLVPEDLSQEERNYLSIGEVFPELAADSDADIIWSRIALAIVRQFARQLTGFAQSSPEYIFRNFLAGTSSVRRAADRIEVRLPQSPLEVVLRISGAYRSYTLPWHPGVEIWLRAPSD